MANMFEYSLIRVEPDNRRGERVNVGIVVFGPNGPDIRVIDTRKASQIASRNWDAHIHLFSSSLSEIYEIKGSPRDTIEMVSSLDRQMNLTDLGWFEASNVTDYEAQVDRIVDALVRKPRAIRKKQETSIATEIAANFKSANILSAQGEALEGGKVIRHYTVDEGAGLVADFALQNGFLHLATTLSLTSSNPHIGSAASKAITMDKAKKSNDNAKAYCVYAVAPSRKPEVKEHISMLGDYADDIFNWYEQSDQEKFNRLFYDAYNSNFPTQIEGQASLN